MYVYTAVQGGGTITTKRAKGAMGTNRPFVEPIFVRGGAFGGRCLLVSSITKYQYPISLNVYVEPQ